MSNNKRNFNIAGNNNRSGAALLIVLFIVATVSILSLGFAIKADTELLCGKNVELRMDMDYLGMTSLNYAKSFILNPQDVTTGTDGYWQGETGLQMEAGDEYFDISVTRSVAGDTPECTYDITSQAYRLDDGVSISETKLLAQLRLDPFIAYWAGASGVMGSNMKVYGDVYCNGDLVNNGQIYGDVFANSCTGSQTGTVANMSNANVSWPGIDYWRFEPTYYIDTDSYTPGFLSDSSYRDVEFGATASNPLGIYYHVGNLDLHGDCKISGTIVVTGGNLKFHCGTVIVDSFKNNPAIVCEGQLQIINPGTQITGLVQVYQAKIFKDAGDVTINGGLFIRDRGLEQESGYAGNIVVRGDPMKTSIKLMSTSVNMMEWSPVGGAYFKSIKRND